MVGLLIIGMSVLVRHCLFTVTQLSMELTICFAVFGWHILPRFQFSRHPPNIKPVYLTYTKHSEQSNGINDNLWKNRVLRKVGEDHVCESGVPVMKVFSERGFFGEADARGEGAKKLFAGSKMGRKWVKNGLKMGLKWVCFCTSG
jgi:hypothetical protein